MSILDLDYLRSLLRRVKGRSGGDTTQDEPERPRRRRPNPHEREIRQKKQELTRLRKSIKSSESRGSKQELQALKKETKTELFQLRQKIQAEEGSDDATPAGDEPGMLPSFVIVGVKKCGTTFLHHLITQHPNVERGAMKEPGFFANHFDEGLDWYRRGFPPPTWREGRLSITGEATPNYLGHPLAPIRMRDLIPDARVIALLRNPVDRAFSDYQQSSQNNEHDLKSFEEALKKESERLPERLGRDDFNYSGYLSRGIYVDQLIRWRRYFGEEQTLILKSEDLYSQTSETLARVHEFLGLPPSEPPSREARKVGKYREEMAPETREWLRDFFEPHNERLYDYLGRDLGW